MESLGQEENALVDEGPPSLEDIMPAVINSVSNNSSNNTVTLSEEDFSKCVSGLGHRFPGLAPPLSALKTIIASHESPDDLSLRSISSASQSMRKRSASVVFHVIEEARESDKDSDSKDGQEERPSP